MKEFLLAACFVVTVLAAPAGAQQFKSETAKKSNEKSRRGDRAGAIAVLDRAIEKRKDRLEAHQMRADLRLIGGDIEGAISDFTAALAISPGDAKLYERRGVLRTYRRDYAGALEDLNAAVTHGLKTERLYAERARIRKELGETEGSIADYQTALAINPLMASAALGLSLTLERKKGDPEGAMAHLLNFLGRFEDATGGRLPVIKKQTTAWPEVAVRRDEKGKEGPPVFVASSNVVIVGDVPGSLGKTPAAQSEQISNVSQAYGHLGWMYAKKNDFDRALENYEKGLKIKPGDPGLLWLRSQTRLKRGDVLGAIEDLTVAAENPSGPYDSHFIRGMVLLLQGKDAEAEQEFAQHLQKFPENRKFLSERIEEAKRLRAQRQPQ